MIIPIDVKIERVNAPEELSIADPRTIESVAVVPTTPKYRVVVKVLDLERELVRTYVFHSMVDPAQPLTSNIGVVSHSPIDSHKTLLRVIRDGINRALGEEDDE